MDSITKDFLISLNKVDETKKNKQFASTTAQDLSLEKRRVEQHLKPFLKNLDTNLYGTFKLHSIAQTQYKVDGWIYTDKLIFFENKCIIKDQKNFFAEMTIDRGSHIETGWMRKPFHPEVEKHPVLMFVAMETFMKVYDYKAIKTWINNASLVELKMAGGWEWKGEDRRFGGTITAWNIPLEYMERFALESIDFIV